MSSSKPWPFYTEPDFLDVHGLKTAIRRKGEGEAVMYLHGAGLTRRWLPFHEALSQSVDLIAPEHPGYGDTPFPEWLDNFADMVIHYAELLDELGLEKVHLVGHSFGGWIAAEFASFYPERLASLQLIAPAGLKGAFRHDIFRQTGEEIVARLFNGHEDKFPDYLDEGDQVEAIVHNYVESITLARLAWQPRHDTKLERRLARVKAPTQIILAEEDNVIDNAVAARYADLIDGAKVVTITSPDVPTSHLPFVQAPEKLAEMISTFASRSKE
ncbi:alpha/beta hydrolase [Psychromarinibacter sp. C21-152]|uniref:Alpha/beta hydrolase n=1 Tax=Psychromarinibacter sediminicola TaxID=3033385 RepID=A0AAE3NRZ9_9RHOB|nr:alpha/beta hydrolase [Psychromarinibacter sediminicola]MDF0600986.1 alpha/beta hydrolase [Psychromarinibacter sediminicola]